MVDEETIQDYAVFIERLSITGGNSSGNGGGIRIDTNVPIYMIEAEVANNQAVNGGGVWIERARWFWAEQSSYNQNTSADSCGGIFAGELDWVLNLYNVTIAENTATSGEGGGLCLGEGTSERQLALGALSIVNNSAGTTGGGIMNRGYHDPDAEFVFAFVAISLFAGNTAGISGDHCAFAGDATVAFVSTFNMYDGEGCIDAGPDDIITATPGIGTLALHAPGHTRTVNLLPTSPAIDVLPAIPNDTDQRGVRRPSGYGLDIGAYELIAPGVWVYRPGLWPAPDLFPLFVGEDGTTSTFEISIGSEPQGTVIYTFSDAGGDLSFDPPQIVFTAENWDDNAVGVVTVSAVDDAYVESLESAEIIFAVSSTAPEYAGRLPLTPIDVEVTDNDVAQVIVTPSMTPPVVVSEDGTTASFAISLTSEPAGAVVVTFGGMGSDFALDQPSVEFDASDWELPVTVTVSTTDDEIAEGTRNGVITFTVSGTASEYAGIIPDDLAVTILDDDNAGVDVVPSVSPLVITEAGTPESFAISLTSAPTGTVTVTFGGMGSDFALDQSSVEFDASDWELPVTVTVSTTDDEIAEDTKNGVITFTVSGTASEYAGITPDNLAVTVMDDDSAGVDVVPSTSPLVISEDGTTASFAASLTSEPTGTVRVTFGGMGSDRQSISPRQEIDARIWNPTYDNPTARPRAPKTRECKGGVRSHSYERHADKDVVIVEGVCIPCLAHARR